jgi:hypothetical protein
MRQTQKGKASNSESISAFADAYIYSTIALLAVLACALLHTGWGESDRLLRQPNALFGLTTQTLLMIGAGWYLMMVICLSVCKSLFTRALLILWMALIHFIYGLGMYWLRAEVPFPATKLLARQFRIKSVTVDHGWKALVAYLFIGSLACLWIERKRYKQAQFDAFVRNWHENKEEIPLAGQAIPQAASQDARNTLTHGAIAKHDAYSKRGNFSGTDTKTKEAMVKSVPLEFKFSCPHCGQHIQCDQPYVNQQIKCPSCERQITVLPP